LKQKKYPLNLSSTLAFGVSPESSRRNINALVPGDSGGNTILSDEAIRIGTTGSDGEMVEIYRRSIYII
jgi:hypothetical protein